jgi:ABC-type uncharacterized transport system permease subunit
MHALVTVAFIFGVVAYSASATLYFVNLARREGAQVAALWAPRVQLFGGAMHCAHLLLASFATHICPVASLPFALSLSALVMAVAHGLLGERYGVSAMGVAVAPLALMFLIGAQFIGTGVSSSGLSPTLLALHVTANLLGLALFLLAAAAGAFYLLQERRLKAKKGRLAFGRLPALDVLDAAEHRLLLAGFPLLTFGVVSGAMFMQQMADMTTSGMVRAGLAYLTWFVVASVLLLRAIAGWRGRRTAYGTLLGTAFVLVIILAYVVRAGAGVSP